MSLGLYKDPLSALNVLCTSHLTTMPSNAARPLSRENSAEEAVILHARRVPLTRDWFNDAASSTDDPAIEEVHAKNTAEPLDVKVSSMNRCGLSCLG